MTTETTAGSITIDALTDPDSGEVRYVGMAAEEGDTRE
jgi:hypothetical protein